MQSVIHSKRWGRETFEDELTGITFGPLRYLAPDDVVRVLWGCLADKQVLAQSETVQSVQLLFWPREIFDVTLIDPNTKAHVEPDLVAIMKTTAGCSSVLVVEVKWNARLSSTDPVSGLADQCERQVRAVLNAVRRTTRDLTHVLLSQHHLPNKVDRELTGNGSNVTSPSYSYTTWLQFITRLKRRERSFQGALVEWTRDVTVTLERLGAHVFDGFREIERLPIQLLRHSGPIFFHRVPLFSWLAETDELAIHRNRNCLFFDVRSKKLLGGG